MAKIKVISAVRGRAGIDDPDLRISRRWPSMGSVVQFEKETLEELMYNPSFKYMIDTGMLYVEDEEVKEELGISPEIILLTDKELQRYWKNMPASQFKLEIQKLSKEQLECLAEYAMSHGDDGDFKKAEILSKATGYSITKGIELEKQSKEA